MIKRQIFGFALILGLLILVGWQVSKHKLSLPQELSRQKAITQLPKAASSVKDQDAPTEQTFTASSPVTELPPSNEIPASLKKDLRAFHQISLKTFASEEEIGQKKKLLQDGELISNLGQVLLDPQNMNDPQYEELENAALDLLLNAFRNGDREASWQVIQKIVTDGQVENPKLPQNIREVLAGIKAEVLYQASALEPQAFSEVASRLPGPVSQKIWANVQRQQNQNLKESEAEVQAHLAQWGH